MTSTELLVFRKLYSEYLYELVDSCVMVGPFSIDYGECRSVGKTDVIAVPEGPIDYRKMT